VRTLPAGLGEKQKRRRRARLAAVELDLGFPSRLYHLALEDEWDEAVRKGGPYRRSTLGRSVGEVGFIHCSLPEQVQGVADQAYGGRRRVVLLTIDRSLLADEVRMENLDGGDELFPHLYGELPLDAVVQVDPVPVGDDGRLAVAALLPLESD
jgi:uncharacterized protein (DUF952 family)